MPLLTRCTETRRPTENGLLTICCHWLSADVCSISLKDSGEERSFQPIELGAVYMVAQLSWKKRPEVQIYIDLWVVVNHLPGWSRTWKEDD